MDIEEVRKFCLNLKNTTEDMPFGDDVLTFRVENKIYLALSLKSEEPKITVRNEPEIIVEMREKYQGVVPAFHWNKKFWNNILLQCDLNENEIKYWIEASYRNVISKLPKKVRALYENQ